MMIPPTIAADRSGTLASAGLLIFSFHTFEVCIPHWKNCTVFYSSFLRLVCAFLCLFVATQFPSAPASLRELALCSTRPNPTEVIRRYPNLLRSANFFQRRPIRQRESPGSVGTRTTCCKFHCAFAYEARRHRSSEQRDHELWLHQPGCMLSFQNRCHLPHLEFALQELHHFCTDFCAFKSWHLDYQPLAKLFAPCHFVSVPHFLPVTVYASLFAPFLHRFLPF